MALFDPCLEFENFLGQMTSFEVLLKCHSLTLSKKCLKLCPALSMCLSDRINWIISRIPHRISKILFVYGYYEFLAMLEGAVRSLKHFLDKVKEWHFHSTSNEIIQPKKISNSMLGSKSAILAIFFHHWISKILFVLSADLSLEKLKSKTRECPFF